MAERTSEQILDEVVYAVQCVTVHYGPGFNEDGLRELRKVLNEFHTWWTDGEYTSGMLENDEHEDFHQRIIWPEDWRKENFNEVVKESRGEIC